MKVTLIASVFAVAQAAVVDDNQTCVVGDTCASKTYACCNFKAEDGSAEVLQCHPSDSQNIVIDGTEYAKGTCPTAAPVAEATGAKTLTVGAAAVAAAAYCLA